MAPNVGKLKRITKSKTKPPYTDPTRGNGQRRLPWQKPRGDLYAVDDSPVKASSPNSRATKSAAPQFSPIRKQKTAASKQAKAKERALRDLQAREQELVNQQLHLETPNVANQGLKGELFQKAHSLNMAIPEESIQSRQGVASDAKSDAGQRQPRGFHSIVEAAEEALAAAAESGDETQRLQFTAFGRDAPVEHRSADALDEYFDELLPGRNVDAPTRPAEPHAPFTTPRSKTERLSREKRKASTGEPGSAKFAGSGSNSRHGQASTAKSNAFRPSAGARPIGLVVVPSHEQQQQRRQREEVPSYHLDKEPSKDEAVQSQLFVSEDEADPGEVANDKDTIESWNSQSQKNCIEKIRPEDLEFNEDAQSGGEASEHEQDDYTPMVGLEADEEEEEVEAAPMKVDRVKSKKRRATETASAANTKAKRTKRHRGTTDALVPDHEEEENEHELEGDELYGQLGTLRGISRTARHMLKKSEELEEPTIEALVEECEEIKENLKKLSQTRRPEDDANVQMGLEALFEGLRWLYKRDHNHSTTYGNTQMSLDLHGHLFPRLALLLQNWLDCYSTVDGLPIAHPLTNDHVGDCINLIGQILSLGEAAAAYARPDSSSGVLKPVKNKILVPLRQIHRAMRSHFEEQTRIERLEQAKARYARERHLAEERERREAEETAAFSKRKRKWDNLHVQRQLADGPLWFAGKKHERDQRTAFLRCPDYRVDEDHNGEPFSRMEVFHPRVAPPPDLVAKARGKLWSMIELDALVQGLRNYAGENVYERVFWRYCGPPGGRPGQKKRDEDGLLRIYNVTDIVTTAAGLKAYYFAKRREAGMEVEQWVRDIPVWVRPADVARGQENPRGSGRLDLEGDD